MDCIEAEKLKLAEFSLKNEAQVWWEVMGGVNEGDGVPMSYDVFEAEFEKKYVPNGQPIPVLGSKTKTVPVLGPQTSLMSPLA